MSDFARCSDPSAIVRVGQYLTLCPGFANIIGHGMTSSAGRRRIALDWPSSWMTPVRALSRWPEAGCGNLGFVIKFALTRHAVLCIIVQLLWYPEGPDA